MYWYLRLNQVRILIEKTQQVSFGTIPKGTRIMIFFNLFFGAGGWGGRKGKDKV